MNAVWAKSTLSFSNGNCVEVTELPGGAVGVRNSKDPGGPVLRFSRDEWDAFLGGARLGGFDRRHSDVPLIDPGVVLAATVRRYGTSAACGTSRATCRNGRIRRFVRRRGKRATPQA